MQSRSHRRGGTFLRERAPSTTPFNPPARSSPTNPSSIPHFEPPALELRAILQRARGGPKTERLIGNEVWRTRDASPPHTVHAAPRGRSRKQVANRRLPSGSSSLGLPELKKIIYTPNLLHPTLGITEVRVWFERRRPVLSPSMASWIKFGLIN